MGKLSLVLLFSLSAFTNSFSQSFSIDELISLYENDNNYFDTYALKKGYVFITSPEDRKYEIEYTSDIKSPFENLITIVYFKAGDTVERGIVWTFKSVTAYLNLKADLNKEGYKLDGENSSGADGSGHQFAFKNEKYKVNLITYKSNLYSWPMYSIMIRRL